jgi:hypothetical protein
LVKISGEGPLGRPRSALENYIQMNLMEIGFGDLNCIELAQNNIKW